MSMMKMTRAIFVLSTLVAVLLGIGLMLTAGPTDAHALFSTYVHEKTYHRVKPFPVDLTVETSTAEVRGKEIGADRFKVTIVYSDGSTREAVKGEYEVTPSEIPSGFKGNLEGDLTFREGGHELKADFAFLVDGAYGAQYGHTLVFGRGIPADTFAGDGLTNVTWGLEEEGCVPQWDRGQLTSVTEVDTVVPVSMASWFSGAASLREASFTKVDTSRAKSFMNMFSGCSALTSVEGIDGWSTVSMTSCENMFRNAAALKTVDLSRWSVANCTSFWGMFANASNLTSAGDLSAWDTASAIHIGCMFQWCPKLTSVGNIGSWKVGQVTSLQNLFQGCTSLTYVGDLSSWSVGNVLTMREAFQSCSQLSSVGNIGGWTTGNCTNMYQTFQFCTKLNVNCSGWNVTKVTTNANFNGNGATGVIPPQW